MLENALVAILTQIIAANQDQIKGGVARKNKSVEKLWDNVKLPTNVQIKLLTAIKINAVARLAEENVVAAKPPNFAAIKEHLLIAATLMKNVDHMENV